MEGKKLDDYPLEELRKHVAEREAKEIARHDQERADRRHAFRFFLRQHPQIVDIFAPAHDANCIPACNDKATVNGFCVTWEPPVCLRCALIQVSSPRMPDDRLSEFVFEFKLVIETPRLHREQLKQYRAGGPVLPFPTPYPGKSGGG